MTEIPANTPRPIGRTESDLPGTSKAGGDSVLDGCSAAAAVSEEVEAVELVDSALVPGLMLVSVKVGDASVDGTAVRANEVGMLVIPMTEAWGLEVRDAAELVATAETDVDVSRVDFLAVDVPPVTVVEAAELEEAPGMVSG